MRLVRVGSSGPYATVGVAEGDQLCQQGEALGAACNTRLLWLAGASEGLRDGMGTESRYYHPTGEQQKGRAKRVHKPQATHPKHSA